MKCYFAYNKDTKQKVLIPFCYGSLHRNDKKCCTCVDYPTTAAGFEKKLYNEEVEKLRDQIKHLLEFQEHMLKENNELHRVITKLAKRK
jgi:O-acetyl-ADP-ribose deacetylase (regulator of RNase III)